MPGPHVHDFEPLLAGASPARERLEALIERIASTPRTTALVRGERGAPLAAAARLIHARSARSGRPCVVLRASDSLGEGFAERLHGERGALGAAAGGTLILHEVHELADDAQRALLGELTDASFDVRVVATSSADLEEEVALGRLREDLFYRLNVLALHVPALRERADDLVAIARAAMEPLAEAAGRRCPGLTADAALALRAHAWPGDLAELRGVLAAALARTRAGAVSSRDLALPSVRSEQADPFDGERNLKAIEERVIRVVLRETNGNKSRAARVLGLNRQTLYNKLEALPSA